MGLETVFVAFMILIGMGATLRLLLVYQDSALSFGHTLAIKDTLFEAIIMFGAMAISVVAFYSLPKDQRQLLWTGVYTISSLGCWLWLASGIYHRIGVGKILIDLGYNAMLPGNLILGVMLIGVTVSELLESELASSPDIPRNVARLSIAAIMLFAGLNRTLITERGFFYGASVTKWDRIRGFELRSRKYSILQLRIRHWLPGWDIRLVIPSESQESVRAILHQRLGQQLPE